MGGSATATFFTRHRPLTVDIGSDEAGIDRKAFAANQTFGHAARNRHLEQLAKKVEMQFAHLKLDGLRLRGPNGAKDEFHLAAAAQNLRKMATIIPMPSREAA